MAVVFCSGCESSQTAPNNTSSGQASPSSSAVTTGPAPAAPAACNVGTRGAPDVEGVYSGQLPSYFGIREICAADVGPALAGADALAGLSDLTAAEITDTYSSPDRIALKALVGTAKSGDADAFVNSFLSRVGETRNDTVTLDGHTVRYFNSTGGEGYAYAQGPTVVIGYIPPPGTDLAGTQETAKSLYTRITAAATGTPIPVDSNDRLPRGIEGYSPGRGRYTTPDDPGWVFFKTDGGKGAPSHFCGIGPNGAVAGCDLVPSKNVPAGMNQTIVDASGPAHYVHSDTPAFTRDVDVLLEGHRLDNGQASCGRAYQGTISCVIGEHSFVVSSDYGILH